MLRYEDGTQWLIDCGRQAPDQLEAAGLTWHAITGQIITHVHGDHTFGLEDFAFMRYYTTSLGVAPIIAGGPRPYLVTHDAVLDEIWQMLAPSLRYLKKGEDLFAGRMADYFEVVAPHKREDPQAHAWEHAQHFRVGPMDLIARENEHVPGKPSTALEISIPGQSGRIAWWSGDSTVVPEDLIRLASVSSVLFHDCTFVEYTGQVHGSFAMLSALPQDVREKMVLMHHEDDLDNHRQRAEAIGYRIALPGDVYDLATGIKLGSAPS